MAHIKVPTKQTSKIVRAVIDHLDIGKKSTSTTSPTSNHTPNRTSNPTPKTHTPNTQDAPATESSPAKAKTAPTTEKTANRSGWTSLKGCTAP